MEDKNDIYPLFQVYSLWDFSNSIIKDIMINY